MVGAGVACDRGLICNIYAQLNSANRRYGLLLRKHRRRLQVLSRVAPAPTKAHLNQPIVQSRPATAHQVRHVRPALRHRAK